jgi:hypothetical protein
MMRRWLGGKSRLLMAGVIPLVLVPFPRVGLVFG